jgi:hypothetical protein
MTDYSFISRPGVPAARLNPAVVLPGCGDHPYSGKLDGATRGFDPVALLDSPEAFCRAFLEEHARAEFNRMHYFSFEEYRRQMAEGLPGRTGRRLAIAAPRGAAKSTIHTMLFPIMDILSGRERHQVIISGTMQQARNRLATIAHELRHNGAIRDAFSGVGCRGLSRTRGISRLAIAALTHVARGARCGALPMGSIGRRGSYWMTWSRAPRR